LLPQKQICYQIIIFSVAKVVIYKIPTNGLLLKIYKNTEIIVLFDENQPRKVSFCELTSLV